MLLPQDIFVFVIFFIILILVILWNLERWAERKRFWRLNAFAVFLNVAVAVYLMYVFIELTNI